MVYAGSFDGSYIGLGLGAQYNNVYNHTSAITNIQEPSLSDTHITGQVFAGYGVDITPAFNFGANIFYNLSDESSGSAINTAGQLISGKFKNNWGISIEPGYNFSDNMLIHLKLGYARAEYNQTNSTGTNTSVNELSKSMDGFLYGIGVKYAVNRNVYIGADLTEYYYGGNSSTGPSANLTHLVPINWKAQQSVGLVSVGYQF